MVETKLAKLMVLCGIVFLDTKKIMIMHLHQSMSKIYHENQQANRRDLFWEIQMPFAHKTAESSEDLSAAKTTSHQIHPHQLVTQLSALEGG